jgi:hypothetical protein
MAKFAFLAFSEIHPPNILRHQEVLDRGGAASCALSSSVKGVSLGPGLSALSGPSGGVSAASIAGILEVSAAMIRLFSLLASSRACIRSCISAIRRSVTDGR